MKYLVNIEAVFREANCYKSSILAPNFSAKNIIQIRVKNLHKFLHYVSDLS